MADLRTGGAFWLCLLLAGAPACTRTNPNALTRTVAAPHGAGDPHLTSPLNGAIDLGVGDLRQPQTQAPDFGGSGGPDLRAADLRGAATPDLGAADLEHIQSTDFAVSSHDFAGSSLPSCDCTGIAGFGGNQCPLTSRCIAMNCCEENYEQSLPFIPYCEPTPTLCNESPTPQ